MDIVYPATHGDKLMALLDNPKLPKSDADRVVATRAKYNAWRRNLKAVAGRPSEILTSLAKLLNEYKRHVELDLIFDSGDDFLYRQKGQLKLDNTVLQEFLPFLFDIRLVPGLGRVQNIVAGPQASFAGLSFGSPFLALNSGGVFLKLKDQDFSVSKKHQIKLADSSRGEDQFNANFCVSHFAAEIKTNLDKTMFQEASQTAAELKRAVPGSRYILVCEYLDMTPITTKLTSIDEVIVLRKANVFRQTCVPNFQRARAAV